MNLCPVLGIQMSCSTKGMGFLARGFMRMQAHRRPIRAYKARSALAWPIANQVPGIQGRAGAITLIIIPQLVSARGRADNRLDVTDRPCLPGWHEYFGEPNISKLRRRLRAYRRDWRQSSSPTTQLCLSYIPHLNSQRHNANTLGASLFARTYSFSTTEPLLCSRTRPCGIPRNTSGRTNPGFTARTPTITGWTISI